MQSHLHTHKKGKHGKGNMKSLERGHDIITYLQNLPNNFTYIFIEWSHYY